jgi:putative ABC transport system permease protein
VTAMLRATLSQLLVHRGRLVATVLAIVLGVGFVTGTLIFTDAMRASYLDRFARAERGVDAAVEPARGRLDQEALDAVRMLPGVAKAEPRLTGEVVIVDHGGRAVQDASFGISVAADPALRWQEPTGGRLPAAPGEVALDDATAQHAGLRPGDEVRLGAGGRVVAFTMVGTVDPGLSGRFRGAAVAALPTADLQRLLGDPGYDRIDLVARPGTSPEALARQAGDALGGGVRTLTAAELADRAVRSVAEELVAVGTLLGLFALVAVGVAGFVIHNTFTILIAQRARQLALLRCLGAGRAQVFRAVVAEAAALGLAASLAGVGAGLAVAVGLRALLEGLDQPLGTFPPFRLGGGAAAAGLATGVLVTVVAAVLPARRATMVAPLAAFRDETLAPAATAGRLRLAAGGALLAAGGVLLWLARSSGSTAALVAGGALTFCGIVALAPALVGPVARALGLVVGAAGGVPGRLAVGNAVRNPRRAAATTAALMIGVTLLAAFTTGVSSLEATAVRQLRAQFPVEYVVTPLFEAVPPQVVSALAADRRLDVVAPHRVAARRLDGDTVTVAGAGAGYLDAAARGALTEPVTAGSRDRLEDGTVAVSAELAAERGLAPGGTLRLAPPTVERPVSLTVVAVLGGDGRSLLLSLDDHRRLVPGADERVLVSAADGASAAAGREAVTAATAGYAEVRVADFASYVEQLTSEVDQLVAMVGGLLGLAILIALLGIATTLSLSVVERARESALLRALGLTRGQLRGMLAVEAAITALLGAVLGLVLGLVFAWVALGTLAVQSGLGDGAVFSVPWAELGTGVAAAALVGLLASVVPGRQAARVEIAAPLTAAG